MIFLNTAEFTVHLSAKTLPMALAPIHDHVVIVSKFEFEVMLPGKRQGRNSQPEHTNQVAESSLPGLKTGVLIYTINTCRS